MAITEESRRRLHRELTGVMGEEGATLVVEHLPPMDWKDLATKVELRAEIASVRAEMTAGFALVNERFNSMEARFTSMEQRFDERFVSMEQRFDERFKSVDERFKSIDVRFASIEARLAQHETIFATKADVLALSVQLERGLRRLTLTLLFAGFGFVSAAAAVVGVVLGT